MTDNGMWMGLATIIAVLLGPIIAIWITRCMDNLRADKARKLDIFRTLMQTRGTRIDAEHVRALNLVEVEFIKHPRVVETWKQYLTHLGEVLPPIEQKGRFDAANQKRDRLLTTLIDEIAKTLNIKVEQLDILAINYVPQGWMDDEWEQRLTRRGLLDVLYGRAPIKVQSHPLSADQYPYPPPPKAN